MKKLILLICLLFTQMSCTDEDRTIRTLKISGFTNITTTGYEWGACSEHDSYCTGFTATSPSGVKVTGAVGCGFYKYCTVRINP